MYTGAVGVRDTLRSVRLVPLLMPLALVFVGGGCSSTLDEYRCSVQADCRGESAGRCEMSGHCSFADGECASGFRFGSGSGSESNRCVGDSIDAPDANSDTPIARIGETDFPCGVTSDIFNGELSTASSGEVLTEFSWKLRGPGEQLLDSFTGVPADLVPEGLHRYGGTFTNPRINVTTYEGTSVLQVAFTDSGSGADPNLYYPFSSELLGGSATVLDLSLSFALGATSACSLCSGSVRFVSGNNTVLAEQPLQIGSGMQPYQFDYPALQLIELLSPVTLEFRFDQAGAYLVDNVSLWDANGEIQGIANRSVEEEVEPWLEQGPSTGPEDAVREPIAENLQQPGEYRIELKVTDSAGKVSALATRDVEVQSCAGNP